MIGTKWIKFIEQVVAAYKKAGWGDVEVVFVESQDPEIAGWYVGIGAEVNPQDLCWEDRGNGPTVVDDGIFGPFSTEENAWQWAWGNRPTEDDD